MLNLLYHERYCLTKAQKEIIEPLLPTPKTTGRPALNSITVFNAILWILSSGAAWRDVDISRGGKTTKIHALVNENFQLIGLLLSSGHYQHSLIKRKQ